MSPEYDAIICGAGPAGATAALYAARAGLRVALLEKQVLPRHKPCGGGMPLRAGNWLPAGVPEATVECQVRYLRHTWNFGDAHLGAVFPETQPSRMDWSLWMVQRPHFDNALAQAAADAGAVLRDGLMVRSLDFDADGVTVCASSFGRGCKTTWKAKAHSVIGADGANSLVAKVAGLRSQRRFAFAIETEIPHDWRPLHPDLRPDVAHLEYGAVHRGYAWIFPKRETLNVGSGQFVVSQLQGKQLRALRQELEAVVWRYCEYLGIRTDRDRLPIYAHPIPIWQGKEPRNSPDGQVLLVGDAAGLVNPFFGDGLLHGMRSGAIAAQALADGRAQQYTQRLHAEVARNFDTARLLAAGFYRFPHWCFRHIVSQPKSTQVAARLLAGDLAFSQTFGRVPRYLWRRAFAR